MRRCRLLIAAFTPWLEDELPLPESRLITAAGLVTSAWGALLLLASRVCSTCSMLEFVATVNAVVVLAMLAWLAVEGGEMTGTGIVVVGALGIIVLRFAIYQLGLLRQ